MLRALPLSPRSHRCQRNKHSACGFPTRYLSIRLTFSMSDVVGFAIAKHTWHDAKLEIWPVLRQITDPRNERPVLRSDAFYEHFVHWSSHRVRHWSSGFCACCPHHLCHPILCVICRGSCPSRFLPLDPVSQLLPHLLPTTQRVVTGFACSRMRSLSISLTWLRTPLVSLSFS